MISNLFNRRKKMFITFSFFSEHVDDIVKLTFQYLEMLRQQEPMEWIFKECQVSHLKYISHYF